MFKNGGVYIIELCVLQNAWSWPVNFFFSFLYSFLPSVCAQVQITVILQGCFFCYAAIQSTQLLLTKPDFVEEKQREGTWIFELFHVLQNSNTGKICFPYIVDLHTSRHNYIIICYTQSLCQPRWKHDTMEFIQQRLWSFSLKSFMGFQLWNGGRQAGRQERHLPSF